MATEKDTDLVMIFCGQSGQYWRQDACGYTNAFEAGIYTRAEAKREAGHCGPEKRIEYHPVHENNIHFMKMKSGAVERKLQNRIDTLVAENVILRNKLIELTGEDW